MKRAPDIIIGSWCGKKFQPAKVRARPGFEAVPAVIDNRLDPQRSNPRSSCSPAPPR